MAVKEICRMGNPILRKEAEEVKIEDIKTDEMKALIEDLKDSMDHYGGIGIAAPQIGISKQVCIIQLDEENERYNNNESYPFSVFINPVITVLDEEPQGFWEGCLSVPGLRGFVERPSKVQVDYLDENAEKVTIIAEGFFAVVLQHELDHLFGWLYIDRIHDTKKISYNEEFDQFIMPSLSENEC
jgi:peptide deformylase